MTKEKKFKLKSIGIETSTTQEDSTTGNLGDLADTLSSKRRGKKGKADEVLQSELLTIKEGLDNVAQALQQRNAIVENSRPQVYSSEEVFQELTKMELDPHFRCRAYRFLNAIQARIQERFRCPPEERKAYLMDMLEDDTYTNFVCIQNCFCLYFI